jgi:hypothetical protein
MTGSYEMVEFGTAPQASGFFGRVDLDRSSSFVATHGFALQLCSTRRVFQMRLKM